MDDRNVLCEKAVKLFLEGYNCAQSVLLTMFGYWNGENELVPKIATAFGGGIGRCGSVCGALTGGIMALGIKYGTNEPSLEKRLKAYKLAERLYKQFETKHKSVLCRELIGYELSNPEELEKARKTKVFEEKCTNIVRTVVEKLVELS
ncbi:MAG: C-GCAxxG-C-C family protein [Candidatus Bathyarchaeota archaeon]|nr:C-GCAxxG-C-C family protein [Candidatus Bathyarchaeota archaeon]MDH5786714.1 C-GCAxxG-C-C family protein [Candidatus Bathyarchaeota archaeon]